MWKKGFLKTAFFAQSISYILLSFLKKEKMNSSYLKRFERPMNYAHKKLE